ncbi:hypothetical protein JCM31598_38760 [Desulfonatronum parangueonense]
MIVTTQQSRQKDLDSDSVGLRRYVQRGYGLLRFVIPAKAGIQCWRMVIHHNVLSSYAISSHPDTGGIQEYGSFHAAPDLLEQIMKKVRGCDGQKGS